MNVRDTLCQVTDRAERPLPDTLELQRLTEALAELYDGLRIMLRAGIAEAADIVDRKVRHAQEDAKRELLGFFEHGELLAILETPHGLELLPYTSYWAHRDGTPTLDAKRVFDEGTARSINHPAETGIVKVHIGDFRKMAVGFFSPAGLGEMAVQASEEITAGWGWIGLHRVVEVIKKAKGDAAWLEVRTALRLQELRARCIANGVTRDFEPHWLDFLARSEAPETRAVLWFDRQKAWRKVGRLDRASVPIPDRAEDILIPITRCAELWPECSWDEFLIRVKPIPETRPTPKTDGGSVQVRGPEWRRPGPVPTRDKIQTAARRLFAAGYVPAQTVTWKVFQAKLCKELNVEPGRRGYSQDTIEAAVRLILSEATAGESTGN